MMNPQLEFDEDGMNQKLISRIIQILQCTTFHANIEPADFGKVVLVGNTHTQHLFLGFYAIPSGLAAYPPTLQCSTDVIASDLKLNRFPAANFPISWVNASFLGTENVQF